MARVIRIDPLAPEREAIGEAARVLANGGLVGLPTETVYGLAARALDPLAIARVFQAKGRPQHHPLIAHVGDAGQARRFASRWPPAAEALAQAFWPGPLTVVVDRAAHVPAAVSGGAESIALRAPAHAVALAVIAALGEPVAAPSANRYQGVSPTTAAHVVKELGDRVDLVLDAGECTAGIESTVVDARGADLVVLRPGALSIESLRALAPGVRAGPARAESSSSRASPGMDARHYAPRATLHVVADAPEACALARALAAGGDRVGVLLHALPPDTEADARVAIRTLPSVPAEYARGLYRALHEFDDEAVTAIVVQAVPEGDAWWAVADRLRRAATPR